MGERADNRASCEVLKEKMAKQVKEWGRTMGVPVKPEHIERGIRMVEETCRTADRKNEASKHLTNNQAPTATRGTVDVERIKWERNRK